MDTKSETEATKILVIGGTGVVGSYVVEHLVRQGKRPFVLSRSHHDTSEVEWVRGDMEEPATLNLPPVATLYCTADAVLLADILSKGFDAGAETDRRFQFDQRDDEAGHGSRG